MRNSFYYILFSLLCAVGCQEPTQEHHDVVASDTVELSPPIIPELLKVAEEYQNSLTTDSALIAYQKAVNSGTLTTQDSAKAFSQMAFNLITQLGRIEEAKVLIDQYLPHYESSTDSLAMAHLYYAKGLYQDWKGLDSAEYWHSKALSLREKELGQENLDVADSHFAMAEMYRYISDFSRAGDCYQKALDIRINLLQESAIAVGFTYYGLASIDRSMGDFTNALIYGEKALNILKAQPGFEQNNSLMTAAGNCMILLGNINTQIENLQSESFYLDGIELVTKAYGDKFQQLTNFYNNLSNLYIVKGDSLESAQASIEANNYYKLARSFAEKALAIPNSSLREQSRSMNHKGVSLTKLKQYDSAKWYLDRSLEIRLQRAESVPLAYAYNQLGVYYDQKKEFEEALVAFQEALNLLIDGFSNDDILASPNFDKDFYHPTVSDIVENKASCLRSLYMETKDTLLLSEAFKLYQSLDRLSDLRRNSEIRDESKLLWQGYDRGPFELGIDCAYKLYQITGDPAYAQAAFNLMEKNKYLLVFKSLTRASSIEQGKVGVPDSVMQLEASFKSQMASVNQKLQEGKFSDKGDSLNLENLKFEVAQQQKALKEHFAANYPNYYTTKYDSVSIELTGLQEQLRSRDTQFLEYFWGDSVVYGLALSNERLTFVNLGPSADLQLLITQYLSNLKDASSITELQSYQEFSDLGHKLQSKLVAPLLDAEGFERVVVVPDGPLADLPLGALINTPVLQLERVDYRNIDYLINSFRFTVAYSANVLNQNWQRKFNTSAQALAGFSHSTLPGSTQELSALGKIVNLEAFNEEEASEANFKDKAAHFDVLHLAVHGETDLRNPENSRLLFNVAGENEDGILNAYELYDLEIKARLTVLSACETGVGKYYPGVGVFSMARGFAYAGCPSIIMSLWQTADISSAGLMQTFYQELAEGAHIDEALHQAKLHHLQTQDEYGSHPKFWAAYVPLGSTEPIFTEKPQSNSQIWLGLLGILGVLLVVRLYRWRQHSSK